MRIRVQAAGETGRPVEPVEAGFALMEGVMAKRGWRRTAEWIFIDLIVTAVLIWNLPL